MKNSPQNKKGLRKFTSFQALISEQTAFTRRPYFNAWNLAPNLTILFSKNKIHRSFRKQQI